MPSYWCRPLARKASTLSPWRSATLLSSWSYCSSASLGTADRLESSVMASLPRTTVSPTDLYTPCRADLGSFVPFPTTTAPGVDSLHHTKLLSRLSLAVRLSKKALELAAEPVQPDG